MASCASPRSSLRSHGRRREADARGATEDEDGAALEAGAGVARVDELVGGVCEGGRISLQDI